MSARRSGVERGGEERRESHFTKSKTETRFPTGRMREFPSGVNMMFPFLNAVPHKFLNSKSNPIALIWCAIYFPHTHTPHREKEEG